MLPISTDCKNKIIAGHASDVSLVMKTSPEPVVRAVDELELHPSCARHRVTFSANKLAALVARGELAFREPIAITTTNVILDGHARVELARRQGRKTLSCLAWEMTEQKALEFLIRKQKPSGGWNDFTRIGITLDLEEHLQQKARLNQKLGGKLKASSNLTKADRIDVRAEIAAIAGVGTGTVSKAKDLLKHAAPRVLEELRAGTISINRASGWLKLRSDTQEAYLYEFLTATAVNKKIRKLIAEQIRRKAPVQEFSKVVDPQVLPSVLAQLATLANRNSHTMRLSILDAPGAQMFITKELADKLDAQLELPRAQE